MTTTRIYTIPLRKEFQKAAFKYRTNKAVKALKEFVAHHMKTENVLIGEELNEYMWSQGITNPPAKVQVEITTELKDDKLEAFVNLVGFKKKVVEAHKRNIFQKQGLKDKLQDAVETLKGNAENENADVKTDADSKEAKPKKVRIRKKIDAVDAESKKDSE